MTIQNFEKFAALSKDNAEALVKSGTVAAEGFKTLAAAYSSLAKQSIERITESANIFFAIKSPAELQSVSVSLAKANVEAALAESRKFQELAKSVVTESFAPITARVQAVSSLFKAA